MCSTAITTRARASDRTTLTRPTSSGLPILPIRSRWLTPGRGTCQRQSRSNAAGVSQTFNPCPLTNYQRGFSLYREGSAAAARDQRFADRLPQLHRQMESVPRHPRAKGWASTSRTSRTTSARIPVPISTRPIRRTPAKVTASTARMARATVCRSLASSRSRGHLPARTRTLAMAFVTTIAFVV